MNRSEIVESAKNLTNGYLIAEMVKVYSRENEVSAEMIDEIKNTITAAAKKQRLAPEFRVRGFEQGLELTTVNGSF